MKKKIVTVGLLMMSGMTLAQVGIGTKSPHKSALLELRAESGQDRGVLIPRISLKGLNDKTTINKGDIAKSLLIFNTNDQNGVTPGFYYWSGTSWLRVIDAKDIESIVVDITGTVIENITEILNETTVQDIIYQTVAAKGKALIGEDAIIVSGGDKAVLSNTTLSLKDGGIRTEKLQAGANKTFLVTTNTGEVKWVDQDDELIQGILKTKETITVLKDLGNGQFTYYSESDYNKDGQIIGKGVTFDANTLEIIEQKNINRTAIGVYDFYDKSKDTPIATINVSQSVINNISTILNDSTVKQEIYNAIQTHGQSVTAKDGSILIDNGDKAVLNAMHISVADKGITPSKLAPGVKPGQLLVTNVNGDVQWLDATDQIIKDALYKNERVTVLKDNGNGTFTYFNEQAIDPKTGALISDKGVKFDANTLRIVERTDKKEKGIYDFYDGLTSLQKPLMSISTRANAIYFDNNTSIEGDNLQVVIDNIISKIEIAQGKPASLKGEGILINGDTLLAGAVLKEVMLSIGFGSVNSDHLAKAAVTRDKLRDNAIDASKIENQAVTTDKIKPGVDKQLLVTKDGKAQWVAVSDDIIMEVVKTHEVITLVVNNHDGTYHYYNEKGVDSKGNPILSQGQLIDANTLTITEEANGKYIFRDGKTKTGPALAEIDIKATVIENIDQILANVDVQNSIYTTVANKGEKLSGDKAINVSGDGKEVLSAVTLSLNDNSIEPIKLEPGENKTFLVTTNTGEVKWVSADDNAIDDILKLKETVTVLDISKKAKGVYTYYNEQAVKNNSVGVDIDVNSLSIDNNKKGVFVFKDLSSDNPLATIDIPQEVINNVSVILNNTEVQNQINNIIKANANDLSSADSSIVVQTGVGAVLQDTKISIAEKGVNTSKLADAGVTPIKLAPGASKTFLVTTNTGEVKWIDANDKELEDILKLKETVTVLEDLGTGQFVYKNETDIKQNKPGIIFDANTLTIKEEVKGIYSFYDKTSSTDPIAKVDVPASVISNINTILNDPKVRVEISNIIDAKAQNVESTDKSIAITGGDKAVLSHLTLNIAEAGVTTNKISSKVEGVNAPKGTVLTAEGDGTVGFKTATESVEPAMKGSLTGEDTVINVSGGKNVLYGKDGEEAKISINPGGITSNHIQNETIVNSDIAFKTIEASKLDATNQTPGHIATVQQDGTVSYQALNVDSIQDKGNVITKDGITVNSGTDKVLSDFTIGLADGKVAPSKLTPSNTDKYLLVTKQGKAQWVAATDTVIDDAVKTNETVTILENKGKGIYNYRNESDIKNNTTGVDIDVNSLTIDNNKPGVYVFKDLSDNNPLATIDIQQDVINSIVTIIGDTNVKQEVYKIVASQGKAITSTDGSLTIPTNNKAGLEGLNIEIAEGGVKGTHIATGAVDATKLSADTTLAGHVATVNTDGTVSYKSLTSKEVTTNAAALKTDGIILIGDAQTGSSTQAGTLFKETTLSIKNQGIGEDKLADNAVTNQKIAIGAVTVDKIKAGVDDLKRVMVTDEQGVVKWGELDDIVTDAAGNLTSSDNIIDIKGTSGPVNEYGQNALFKDVVLSINDNSIINQKIKDQTIEIGKLSSEGSKLGGGVEAGMVMVTNAKGGFEYVGKETITQQGADLTLASELEFTLGNGESAVITETGIGIKNKGISSSKLADQAVTIEKISSIVGVENAAQNSVLTAKGDGTVEYKKLNTTAFEGTEANLLSDGSLTIPTDNKALLKETKIGIANKGVKNQHIDDNAVTTDQIADEQVTTDKIKPGVAKQLLITNNGTKAQWVDASDQIVKEIVNSNETITLLTDKGNGTFVYQNEADIKGGAVGITFDANTLKIDTTIPGIYVFKDGKGELATINVSGDVINSITKILGDTNVQNQIYNVVSNLGKTVSTDQAISVTGGEKAVLHPMTISLNDAAVTTKKMTSTTEGIDADNGTVLTADGQGNVVFKPLNELATTQGKQISSKDKSLIIAGNKAALEALNIDVADSGIKSKHIQAKAVTVDKIGTNEPSGKVLASTGEGAEFKTLAEVIGKQGKEITGDNIISVSGGKHAVLSDVSLSLNDNSIVEGKLALDAVTTNKIKDKAVTATKMAAEKSSTILVTNASGQVKWADAQETVIGDIVKQAESVTVLRDNNNGTFTYFNEKEVDNKGNVKDKAKGITFDANTLSIDATTPGVYVFKDHAGKTTLATIDTRASKIIFEGDLIYNNVEEAITNIITKIDELEKTEISKADLTGTGPIKVNDGKGTVLKAVSIDINESSIDATHLADNAITTSKIASEQVTTEKLKPGVAKQILVTNQQGKAQWVDASDDIIKDIVDKNETLTLLTDKGNGTFTYQNENDIKNGLEGVSFDANTLTIDNSTSGVYVFKDGKGELARLNVSEDVINSITNIIGDTNVKEEIFNVVANQGKEITGDNAIDVKDGDGAVLKQMSISLKDSGVTGQKIKNLSITEDKLFAGQGKENYVPVVQGDGTVKYQPMTSVVTGAMLSVDNSLEITGTGDASKALLEELGLQVKASGIANEHLQSLSVSSDKLSSKKDTTSNYAKGDVLMADGSGNVGFVDSKEVINKVAQGDLTGETNVVLVSGGENVLFGDENKKVTVSINKGGIKGGVSGHIAASTITDLNLVNKTISASKLDGGKALEGSVATVGKDGVVSYQALTPSIIKEKGTIIVKDGLTVDNGVDKVLSDLTLGIADISIAASKLDAGDAPVGSVAMVSGNGKSVTYEPLSTDKLTNKADITTDSVIDISNTGKGAVLSDVYLSIKEKGIDTKHIANDAVKNAQIENLAVTANKISSKGVQAKSVLISGSEDNVFWGELKDIVTNTAGNLELDDQNILKFDKGDGVNTLLADVKLGVNNNSITIDKLNSSVDKANKEDGMLLVADGKGGFRFKKAEDASVVTKNLTLGSALTFTNGSTGVDAVLDETSFDVKEQGISTVKLQDAAVTVEKMSSGTAPVNTVLTAKGQGKVAYEVLNEAVFAGKGANLLSDTSIAVQANNQALLKETSISIAKEGVKTNHIADNQVTVSKINPEKSVQGTVLTVDSKGKATFQALTEISKTQGKAITSTDGSLIVAAQNKAALQDVNLGIATAGVKNTHIADKQVTADKIGTGDLGAGLLLTSDGQGSTEFKDAFEIVSTKGKTMTSGAGITITGGQQAALKDVTVSLADKGVSTGKLADKAVTVDKMSSKVGTSNVAAGQMLTADGSGNLVFKTPQTVSSGELKGSVSISVNNGKGALLHDADITIKTNAITEAHLVDNAVTTAKIADKAVTINQIANDAVDFNQLKRNAVRGTVIQDAAVVTAKIANDAITNEKIANLAVDNFKIKNATITGGKLVDGAVTTDKMSSGTATAGYVLTAEPGGKVSFQAAKGGDFSKGSIKGDNTPISVSNGTDAALKDVQLDIKSKSIKTTHLADSAVTSSQIAAGSVRNEHIVTSAVDSKQIKNGAVQGDIIRDKGVPEEKISSEGISTEGYVLTTDGKGGATWKEIKTPTEVKAALPKFFYAPSFYITVEPGDSDEINVYEFYKQQFGQPKTVNKNAQNKALPVLAYDELDYYVLYYDEDVFESVEISDNGNLKYRVKRDAQVGTNTYFNIVFGVRD